MLALKFYSQRIYFALKDVKRVDRLYILCRYFINQGSLAWYFMVTWLVTNWDSLLAFNLEPLISRARTMLTMRSLYSILLLLALSSN